MDAVQVHREAVARVQARKQAAEYRPVRTGWGETQMQKDLPEFKAPDTAGEFFDARIAMTPPSLGPWVPVLYEIALAGGAPAARSAVADARKLPLWNQWYMYLALKYWGTAVTTATPRTASEVLQAAADEWGRQGLVTVEPSDEPLPVAS